MPARGFSSAPVSPTAFFDYRLFADLTLLTDPIPHPAFFAITRDVDHAAGCLFLGARRQ
ncbi:hypothetical protein PAMC26577_08320 [Caballeronia sordidicola]|uniref:Uncharacterized protein n=1 Tax=Caballeronia sordidicola TaxID=196367 RepID=A0A242N1S4_CABSO|nr:hypothetical protein PAMC26577_08320 [Caballeronia sordidicola]